MYLVLSLLRPRSVGWVSISVSVLPDPAFMPISSRTDHSKDHFDVVVSPTIPVLASTSLPLTLLARRVAGILRLGKKPANTFANGFHSLRLEPGLLVSVLDPDPDPDPDPEPEPP